MTDPRGESGPKATPATGIDGEALARALRGAARALEAQADAINAINVFPVPDGDTGTNMWMTMRAAVDEIADGAPTAANVARQAARGALMGAKGNSGVILSQILAGFAAMPDDTAALDGAALAAALERGRAAAYKVVSSPKEGTILTAISAAASAARSHAGARPDETLAAAVDAAREAVARTPELLPVLKEAGVVDSGAQGLYVALDGALRALRGEDAGGAAASDLGRIDETWLAATQQLHHDGSSPSYCTEFVLEGQALDAAALRAHLQTLGDSVLVVGGAELLRVHVHTLTPDVVLGHARTLGAVSREKADDMAAQFEALAARPAAESRTDAIAVVAVAAGPGIEALFESMGAFVVRGGQTMNPSAGDIRATIEASGARDVIVLPNNKNIVLAARQAAEGLAQRVSVIESRSVPQGVAALVALNTESAFEENIAAMQEALAGVRTAEVTLAARATKLHGLDVREGQPIGIVDGELAVAGETVANTILACVERMLGGAPAALVTLYRGAGESEGAASAVAERITAQFALEVEVVDGGQPHYAYIIGLE